MDNRYGDSWPPRQQSASQYGYPSNQGNSNYSYPSVQQNASHYPPPPLPAGPPPGYPANDTMYHFGQTSNGYGRSDDTQFNFQPQNNLPSYPDHTPPSNRYRDNYDGYNRRDGHRRDYDRRDRHDRRDRPRFVGKRMAADRPLLHRPRDTTPDQLEGMQGNDMDHPKFRDIDAMSDTDSEVMEQSDDDELEGNTTKNDTALEEKSAPRWSNPEPYTALPPPEVSKKRKDVVKLIRKARIAAEKDDNALSQLAAKNDDFISFGFEEEIIEAPANAPTGPKADRKDIVTEAIQNETAEQVDQPVETRVFEPVSNNIASKLASQKRKRSDDDDGDNDRNGGRNPTASLLKRLKTGKPGQNPTGAILPDWASKASTNSTPWAAPHQWTENAGFRLHKEICDFYDFVKPRDYEEIIRLDLLRRIRECVKSKFRDGEVHAFGSFAAGLYLPDADLDLVVISRSFATTGVSALSDKRTLYAFSSLIETRGLALPGSVETIIGAKVPIVKFKDSHTGLRVDVSFENLTGPRANATFKDWKTAYPAMPILVTVIKQFLMMRGLNEVVNGGLGGFSVTCLVTALLQNMPRVQTGELVPEHHLGEVLLELLDLYGNQFDLYSTAIELNPPGFISKASVTLKQLQDRETRLHIVDPNDRDNDISGGSKNVSQIFKLFSYARLEILRAMRYDEPQSLLGWMLGGDYTIYAVQREYMRQLHKNGNWKVQDFNHEEQLLNELMLQTRNFSWASVKSASQLTRKRGRPSKAKEASSTRLDGATTTKNRKVIQDSREVNVTGNLRDVDIPMLEKNDGAANSMHADVAAIAQDVTASTLTDNREIVQDTVDMTAIAHDAATTTVDESSVMYDSRADNVNGAYKKAIVPLVEDVGMNPDASKAATENGVTLQGHTNSANDVVSNGNDVNAQTRGSLTNVTDLNYKNPVQPLNKTGKKKSKIAELAKVYEFGHDENHAIPTVAND